MALSSLLRTHKPKFYYYPLRPPSLHHLFSTATPQNDQSTPADQQQQQQQPSSPFSSYFSDVKSKLKQQQQPSTARPGPFLNPASPAAKVASLEEIRKNLSEFRRRSAIPDSSRTDGPPSPSFEELYKKNAAVREAGTGTNEGICTRSSPNFTSNFNVNKPPGLGKLSLEAIKESLKKMRSNNPTPQGMDKRVNPQMPISDLKKKLLGGTDEKVLPQPSLVKEGKMEGGGEDGGMMDTEFVKEYSKQELGQKLASLRPDEAERKKKAKEEGGWFLLEELQDRLRKLRALDDREVEARIGGLPFGELRKSLVTLRNSDEEKKKRQMQRFNLMTHFGQTPNLKLEPPKEHLVEKYFHPDNMSASEKLKIELAKIRDEFKLSESDCGSARVQVAQLTTKIKYLSSVLHKKDKHSLKGLQAMVQQRKKLLKYLRRTDWDSYCFVLSKLGLRDNPDYKIRSH